MDLRIHNQNQSDIDPAVTLKSANPQPGSGGVGAHNSNLNALNAADDTASISGATVQLSGDVAVRHDRVDALRSQLEGGTYTLNSRAIATAMFQNLFRS